MAISFFRRGPTETDAKSKKNRLDSDSVPEGGPITSLLDYSQIGEARALAAAAGKIQVDELSDSDHPAIEEAAILFASGADSDATAVLEAAIDEGAAGNETLWFMLFDLCRLTGNQEAFDQRGVAFAEQFGRSPPVWAVSGPASAPKAAEPRNAVPTISLTGKLGSESASQFEQIEKIAQKAGKLKIELGRLRSVEDSGCELLLALLARLRKARVKVHLSSPRTVLAMIENHAQPGRREGKATWLMVLELIQALGEADRFDEVALDYAITFEESPPSFEAPSIGAITTTSLKSPPADSGPHELELVPIEEEAPQYVLEGEITSSQADVVQNLAKYGAERKRVEIDASRLQRMDFVSAGTLFNVLVRFQGQGKQCEIQGLNAMVAALMRVIGIDQVATMALKRN